MSAIAVSKDVLQLHRTMVAFHLSMIALTSPWGRLCFSFNLNGNQLTIRYLPARRIVSNVMYVARGKSDCILASGLYPSSRKRGQRLITPATIKLR